MQNSDFKIILVELNCFESDVVDHAVLHLYVAASMRILVAQIAFKSPTILILMEKL